MKPKKGRPRIEKRAQTIEAKRPWIKLGMSRRTWYRRRAEQREGRERSRLLSLAPERGARKNETRFFAKNAAKPIDPEIQTHRWQNLIFLPTDCGCGKQSLTNPEIYCDNLEYQSSHGGAAAEAILSGLAQQGRGGSGEDNRRLEKGANGETKRGAKSLKTNTP